ncbi:hypothetical protein [Chitiniphilus shinanonensis]|uniref:hypothetical protein n=1 Tax=Chitiniphilus shinanonensis TaxID=553088 RepID=UPI00146EBF5C|nr:hypothetical protein [Chitiniphilus shinanonensis]
MEQLEKIAGKSNKLRRSTPKVTEGKRRNRLATPLVCPSSASKQVIKKSLA